MRYVLDVYGPRGPHGHLPLPEGYDPNAEVLRRSVVVGSAEAIDGVVQLLIKDGMTRFEACPVGEPTPLKVEDADPEPVVVKHRYSVGA